MRIGILANPKFPTAIEISKRVIKALAGHEVILDSLLAEKLGEEGVDLDGMGAEVLITIGGDGTILRALQATDSTILGINLSRLGFLTEVGEDEIDEAIERFLKGDYIVEERLKLRTELGGERLVDCTNEAVVHTASIAKIRDFQVSVDGKLVDYIRADGIIVSTPTGSTCYAMSAGGPIVDPRVDAFVITSIAPFKLSPRPCVVPATSKIEIKLREPKPCILVLDGQEEVEMSGDETVSFTASEDKAKFIRFDDDFFERVRDKLT